MHVKMSAEAQFMLKNKIDLYSWIEVTHSQLLKRPKGKSLTHTTCQIEVGVNEEWMRVIKDKIVTPPCLYATFDLEMISPTVKGIPRAFRPGDKITSCSIRLDREGQAKPMSRMVLMLGSCDPIDGVDVFCFQTVIVFFLLVLICLSNFLYTCLPYVGA